MAETIWDRYADSDHFDGAITATIYMEVCQDRETDLALVQNLVCSCPIDESKNQTFLKKSGF